MERGGCVLPQSSYLFPQDDPEFVCQALSYSMYFSIDRYYSPGPQSSEIQPISHPQTSEIQPSLLPLQVTGTYPHVPFWRILNSCPLSILRAHNIPRLKSFLGENRRFYATVTHGERTWRSRPVRRVAQRVEWNENVDAL
jgi:hypothetical protein